MIVSRTLKNRIRIKKNDIRYILLDQLTFDSKNVYNCALYCHRQWYRLFKCFLGHVCSNITEYFKDLTWSDIQTIVKYQKFSKSSSNHVFDFLLEHLNKLDLKKLSKLISNKSIYFNKFANSKNENDILNKKSRNKNIHENIEWLNSDFFANNTINGTFQEQMLKTFHHKIDNKNPNKSLANKKKKKESNEKQKNDEETEKNAKNDSKSEEVEEPARVRLLPPSYLGGLYSDIYVRITHPDLYNSIPSQTAQQIAHHDISAMFSSFFQKRIKDPKAEAPNYLDKDGRYTATWKNTFYFQNNSVKLSLGSILKSKNLIKTSLERLEISQESEKYPIFSKKEITIKTKPDENKSIHYNDILNIPFKEKLMKNVNVCQIKVFKKRDDFYISIVYDIPTPATDETGVSKLERMASIDLGMVNLCAIATNIENLQPLIINGNSITGINAKYSEIISKTISNTKKNHDKNTSKCIRNLWKKREEKLSHVFHNISAFIISYCIKHKIDRLIIGYNINWKKQITNMSKESKKKFMSIPYRILLTQLFYKAEQAGIIVVENEESYTSKCDALALENFDICKYNCDNKINVEKRVKRGLYKSTTGYLINADINGAINIMRKHVYKLNQNIEQLDSYISNNPKQFLNPIKITIGNQRNIPLRLILGGQWGTCHLVS